jgi:hypothetical protein
MTIDHWKNSWPHASWVPALTKMAKDELIAVLWALEREGMIESVSTPTARLVGELPQRVSPLAMVSRTGRRTADTDWTRNNEHLPRMRSAGNLRLPRQEHRRNDLVLHHSPARSGLGRRTARPEHIATIRRSQF